MLIDMKQRFYVFAILLTVGILTCFGAPLKAGDPPIITDVCQLANNPTYYAARMVQVRAYIQSDLIHTTILADDTCGQIGVGFALDDWKGRPIGLVKDKNYKELEDLRPKFIELRNKGQKVYGTFEGLYQWQPENRHPRRLVLRKVSGLHVGERDDPPHP